MDGSTPSTAAYAPLILILAASIGSAAGDRGLPRHRGQDLTGQRERRDDQQVRLVQTAQRRDRDGPCGPGFALVAAESRATGTVMACPAPSAFPPSMGTTGPLICAGAGW